MQNFINFLTPIAHVIAQFAATAVGTFLLMVFLDIVMGVAVAIKQHTLSAQKFPSWLETQVGTKAFLALIALVAGAYFANSTNPNLSQVLLATVTAGAASLVVGVIGDVKAKIAVLIGFSVGSRKDIEK